AQSSVEEEGDEPEPLSATSPHRLLPASHPHALLLAAARCSRHCSSPRRRRRSCTPPAGCLPDEKRRNGGGGSVVGLKTFVRVGELAGKDPGDQAHGFLGGPVP
ncbi:unnamed protein product, partial [Urochloa humidicola]